MVRHTNYIGMLGLLLLAACAPRQRTVDPISCTGSGTRLSDAWNALQEIKASAGGCAGENAPRCEQLRLNIDRLGQNCPSTEDILLVNAILAYEDRQLPKAQQYLDTLLSSSRPNAEAAALRARIATEEGNLPFALRFLAEQTRLNGDRSGLREVYASVLFLSGDFAGSLRELETAGRLGAPVWRVEYGKGLVAEATSRIEEAQQHFDAAAKARPEWSLPVARKRAIEARIGKK